MEKEEIIFNINTSLILDNVETIMLSEEAKERIRMMLLAYMETLPTARIQEPKIFFSILSFRAVSAFSGTIGAKIASGGKVFATWTSWMSPYFFALAAAGFPQKMRAKEGASPHARAFSLAPVEPVAEYESFFALPALHLFADEAEALDRELCQIESLIQKGLFNAATQKYVAANLQKIFNQTEDWIMQYVRGRDRDQEKDATFAFILAEINATVRAHTRVFEAVIIRHKISQSTAEPVVAILNHTEKTIRQTEEQSETQIARRSGIGIMEYSLGSELRRREGHTGELCSLFKNSPYFAGDTAAAEYLARSLEKVDSCMREAKMKLEAKSYLETLSFLKQAYRLLAEMKIFLHASRVFNIPMAALLNQQ